MVAEFELGTHGKLEISESGLIFSSHASSLWTRDAFEDALYIYDFSDIEGLYLESLEADLPMIGLGGLFILGLSLLSFRTMSSRKNV